ncbi:MAG: PIN domain nuclease, partial [Ktedonobacteraceae bacterium]
MFTNTISRFVGALLAIVIVIAFYFFDHTLPELNIGWIIAIAAGGALLAFLISPFISVVPYRWMREAAAS